MKAFSERAGRAGNVMGAALRMLLIAAIVQALGLVVFCGTAPAAGKTFTVNSTLDQVDANPGDGTCATASAVCTLRAAIQESNAYTGTDAVTIVLSNKKYTLTIAGRGEDAAATGDLDITRSVTIKGKGSTKTFINGNKLDRVLHIKYVTGALTVNISGVAIQNGMAEDSYFANTVEGGGILIDRATVTLTNCAVSENSAVSATDNVSGGGGIYVYNAGTLTVKNSVISNNTVQAAQTAAGGGIYNESGTVILTGSTVSGNSAWCPGSGAYGGGIWNIGVAFTMTNTTVSRNTVSGLFTRGGGVDAEGGTITITGGSVSDNTSLATDTGYGGGLFLTNVPATVTHCAISRNTVIGGGGGGIFVTGVNAVVDFVQCTVSQNAAVGLAVSGGAGGGFMVANGTLTISGGTISGNQATGNPGWGGGIVAFVPNVHIEGGAKITNNFAAETGGGIYASGGAPTIDSGTVITGNIPNDKNF